MVRRHAVGARGHLDDRGHVAGVLDEGEDVVRHVGRDRTVRTGSLSGTEPGHRRDRTGLTEPARHRLGEDAEGHHVLAARGALPAPEVAGVARPARVPADLDVADAPDRIVAQQPDDRGVRPGRERRRDDHRDPVRVVAGCPQHRARVLGGRGHPCLGQDVLAGMERGDRDRRVEDRPGADQHGVDRWIGEQRLPGRVRTVEPERIGGSPRRVLRAVGDADELDAIDRAEPRDVLGRDDPAGADDPDPDRLCHERPPFVPGTRAGSAPLQPRRRDRSSAADRTMMPAAASLAVVRAVVRPGCDQVADDPATGVADRGGDADRTLEALSVADDVAPLSRRCQFLAEPRLGHRGASGDRVRQPVEDGVLLVGRQEGEDALAR